MFLIQIDPRYPECNDGYRRWQTGYPFTRGPEGDGGGGPECAHIGTRSEAEEATLGEELDAYGVEERPAGGWLGYSDGCNQTPKANESTAYNQQKEERPVAITRRGQ